LLPIAALAVAAVTIAVLVAWIQPAPAPTRQEQSRALAAELRCPDCESLSVAESRTAAAAAIRAEIDQQLAAGRSPAEIRASFIARYGEWILLQPTSPFIWIVPVIALLVGVAVLGWWLVGHRSTSGAATTEPDPATNAPATAERQRIRDEAELLDG
jgi:cytochrome c-type biogenesis protein CcmH